MQPLSSNRAVYYRFAIQQAPKQNLEMISYVYLNWQKQFNIHILFCKTHINLVHILQVSYCFQVSYCSNIAVFKYLIVPILDSLKKWKSKLCLNWQKQFNIHMFGHKLWINNIDSSSLCNWFNHGIINSHNWIGIS